MKQQRNLFVLSICHLLVDGICASVVFGQSFEIWLSYGICAFSLQCLIGMLPDRYGCKKLTVLSGILMLFAILPLPLILKTVVIGFGNSLFHVSGGCLCLKESDNMIPLGIFVAPGAIGLFLGSAFPSIRLPFSLLLVMLTFTVKDCTKTEPKVCKLPEREKLAFTGLLLIAVATRALGGTIVDFTWKTNIITAGTLALFIFLGKISGGIIGDRIGIRRIAILSVVLAAILTVFCQDSMILSLVGQFALNLSMPITLCLIYRLYPDSPGFAFGLAASVLLPGTLLGKIIHIAGIWTNVLILVCFAVGLTAILTAERRLR